MKMQNTEMEFVVFDAQDVIATSGDFDWSGKYMYTLGSNLIEYNNSHDHDFTYEPYVVTSGPYYGFLDGKNAVNCWQSGIYYGEETPGGKQFTYYFDSRTYYLAEDLQQINAWLEANNIQ